jgi:hypothetical protein
LKWSFYVFKFHPRLARVLPIFWYEPAANASKKNITYNLKSGYCGNFTWYNAITAIYASANGISLDYWLCINMLLFTFNYSDQCL